MTEQTMGQWVMGHGSNGSTNVNGHVGHVGQCRKTLDS